MHEWTFPHSVRALWASSGSKHFKIAILSQICDKNACQKSKSNNKVMRIRIDYCADSSERAHTVRRCSFLHEIIQHVEYPTPMARVAKITHHTHRTREETACANSHDWRSPQLITLVCAGLDHITPCSLTVDWFYTRVWILKVIHTSLVYRLAVTVSAMIWISKYSPKTNICELL